MAPYCKANIAIAISLCYTWHVHWMDIQGKSGLSYPPIGEFHKLERYFSIEIYLRSRHTKTVSFSNCVMLTTLRLIEDGGGWSENHDDCELRLTVLRWNREAGVIMLEISLPANQQIQDWVYMSVMITEAKQFKMHMYIYTYLLLKQDLWGWLRNKQEDIPHQAWPEVQRLEAGAVAGTRIAIKQAHFDVGLINTEI